MGFLAPGEITGKLGQAGNKETAETGTEGRRKLSAHGLDFGSCWMPGPTHAHRATSVFSAMA